MHCLLGLIVCTVSSGVNSVHCLLGLIVCTVSFRVNSVHRAF